MTKQELIQALMAEVFNEWARRYAEDPGRYTEVLEDGKPYKDYGEQCAAYFTKLANELDAEGLLSIVLTGD